MCNTLESEVRLRWNPQNSGIKLQELQDLIPCANFCIIIIIIIIIISKIKGKNPNFAIQNGQTWPMHTLRSSGIEPCTLRRITAYGLNPLLLPIDAHKVKNAELLKHSKLDKNAPTCFGLHKNHLQGAKVSAWLKITHLVNSICVKDVPGVARHIFYADTVNQTCTF